jgi:hypothetical protein
MKDVIIGGKKADQKAACFKARKCSAILFWEAE